MVKAKRENSRTPYWVRDGIAAVITAFVFIILLVPVNVWCGGVNCDYLIKYWQVPLVPAYAAIMKLGLIESVYAYGDYLGQFLVFAVGAVFYFILGSVIGLAYNKFRK